MSAKDEVREPKVQVSEEELQILLKYIDTVQYGSVTLHVQDGRIVQIEKSEKIRLK